MYLLITTFLHAMDSGGDEEIVGVFPTKEAAIAAGELYRKEHHNHSQYRYWVKELDDPYDGSAEKFWLDKHQRDDEQRKAKAAIEHDYDARIKAWEAMRPRHPSDA
jgi:protein-tyrosine-phosphatase